MDCVVDPSHELTNRRVRTHGHGRSLMIANRYSRARNGRQRLSGQFEPISRGSFLEEDLNDRSDLIPSRSALLTSPRSALFVTAQAFSSTGAGNRGKPRWTKFDRAVGSHRQAASRVQLTEYLASARVTLSLAPSAKAASTRRRAALVGVGIIGEQASDRRLGQLIGQAVGAEQQDVAVGQAIGGGSPRGRRRWGRPRHW